ncbi:Hypothetical_protein [Hexamita inflata]|uniref:Hypothetical_protein n=1 Tax=Hexamita inflata TaxID=28002 RepID=A0AA86QRE8_9EUKA|nr:Hypothetical protein HINF_LOCUS52266 [Hexamita inflata]
MSRIRLNENMKNNLITNYVCRMQTVYQIQLTEICDIIEYYKNLPLYAKHLFTNSWKELDKSIEKNPNGSKTYSYKFINEVVAGQFSDKWSVQVKERARNFARPIIYQRMEQYSGEKSDVQMYELCKDIIELTFQAFGNFQNEKVVGTPKILQDMLRHFIIFEIPRIRAQLKAPKQLKLNSDLFPGSHPQQNGLNNTFLQEQQNMFHLTPDNPCKQNEEQICSCLFDQKEVFEEENPKENVTQKLVVYSCDEFQKYEMDIRAIQVDEIDFMFSDM